jgi:glyoxylate reductase
MNRPNVWITRQIPPAAVDQLKQVADVEIWPEEFPPAKNVLIEKIGAFDGMISMLNDPLDAEVLEAASRLKVISQMAVGFDNIDVKAATRLGIAVGHTPGVLTETSADFAWALLMDAARRVSEADRQVHDGIWKPWGPDVLTGVDVYGATLGLIGMGRIGKAVAKRAKGFNMRVLYHNRSRDNDAENELGVEYVSLETLLQTSDFVSLHLNYSPEAYHLINESKLALMKPEAILINTARGAVIDADALYNALINKQIAGAALDVFNPEPIPTDHPLLTLPNVVITPHIASASKKTRIEMAYISVENATRGLQGKPLKYCANPTVIQR